MLALCLKLAVSAGPVTSDWAQWGKTPQMQAYNDAATLPAASTPQWTHNASDRVVASPVVANGMVWVATDDGTMSQLDQARGTVNWSWRLPVANNYPACLNCTPKCQCAMIRSTPAVDTDGAVYFGAYDFSVYKLDKSGKMAWNFTTESAVYGPVTLDDDGTVYVGSFDDYLYAIDSDTGKQRWKFNIGSHADCGVAIGTGANAHVLVTQSNEGGACDMGLCFAFGLDKRTGKKLWKSKSTGGPGGGGMIVGNAYLSGSWGQHATSINLETGAENWRVDLGGEIESRPGYHAGVAFFTSEESHTLWALNASTGATLWKYAGATQEFNGSPSIGAGIVYAGANDQYLHAVNATTGALLFKFKTCANVFASVAVADSGMVFIGCNTVTGNRKPGVGAMYAINPTQHL